MGARTIASLGTLLLLISISAFADADAGFGPWRPGMSKALIMSFSEQGPYKESETGSMETINAPFAGHKLRATFSFGATGAATIRFHNYEGSEWQEARKATLEIFDTFEEKFGGAHVKDIADDIQRDELDLILRETLRTADSINKRYASKGQYMVLTFNMVPARQPIWGRLHCQWVYDGKRNAFSVFLFQDPVNARRRDVEDNVLLKKL